MKKIKQLEANSLIETLVASVLASICLVIALMIYSNVLKASYNLLSASISAFIAQKITENEQNGADKSETYIFQNIVITKQVTAYQSYTDVQAINYEAKNSKGKIIYQKKHLKYIESK
jgi:hypothetical protein